jgi:hypothetical protein
MVDMHSYLGLHSYEVYTSLVVFSSNFKAPLPPKPKYDVEVKYRPVIHDNIKYWKVFEYDDELKRFLENIDDFSELHLDEDEDIEENIQNDKFINKIANHHNV